MIFLRRHIPDIKDVYYDRKIDSDVILYKLFVRKMIGGKNQTLSLIMNQPERSILLILSVLSIGERFVE